MMMTIVETPEKIAELVPILREMVCEGVIVCSPAQASRYQRGAPPAADR